MRLSGRDGGGWGNIWIIIIKWEGSRDLNFQEEMSVEGWYAFVKSQVIHDTSAWVISAEKLTNAYFVCF